jgi:hypothetical protein
MLILNEVKIKYDYLDTLLEDKLMDIRFGNNVNIAVDLKEVFRKFFRPNISLESLKNRDNIEELASDIINIVGHYRNYLYKKGKYATFYFLYSKSECEIMKQKHSNYKREYYNKYFVGTNDLEIQKANITKKVVDALEKIMDHIPNTNFIDTSMFDEYTVASFLINKTKSNEINVILSNDELMAQLISKNTFMLNIKGITTKLLDEDNSISVITGKDTKVSNKLLPLLLSISGAERYNLENIDRIGLLKALSMIEKLIISGKIMDTEYVNFPLVKDSFSEKDKTEKLLKDNFEKVEKNYTMIKNSDILYTNTANLTVLFNKPKTMHTFNYYRDLNAKIFSSHPLNLDMLLKGETLK